MLGDDPDPTVTTVRLGFGEAFGRTPEGVGGCAERVKRSDKREAKIRLDSERSTNATERSEEQQLLADARFKNMMATEC